MVWTPQILLIIMEEAKTPALMARFFWCLFFAKGLRHDNTPLPATWNDHTRDDGFHLLFLLPGGVSIPPKTVLASGVELLGANHPLTIPGFVHEDGHINAWDEFLNPSTMELATLPQWALNL